MLQWTQYNLLWPLSRVPLLQILLTNTRVPRSTKILVSGVKDKLLKVWLSPLKVYILPFILNVYLFNFRFGKNHVIFKGYMIALYPVLDYMTE